MAPAPQEDDGTVKFSMDAALLLLLVRTTLVIVLSVQAPLSRLGSLEIRTGAEGEYRSD